MKKRVVALTVAASLLAGFTPAAMAVTPDNGAWVSNWWNTGRVLKEWLDWRSALGWGTIGTANVILTATSGASKGALTKAAFSGMCGTGAAAVMATWTPAAGEVTVAKHAKAVVKAASVVAAASACGWAAQYAFDAIDRRTGDATVAINKLSPANWLNLEGTMKELNRDYVSYQSAMEQYQNQVSNADNYLQTYSNKGCNAGNRGAGLCKSYWDQYVRHKEGQAVWLARLNDFGAQIAGDLGNVNKIIPS